jgi:hypothetical protein
VLSSLTASDMLLKIVIAASIIYNQRSTGKQNAGVEKVVECDAGRSGNEVLLQHLHFRSPFVGSYCVESTPVSGFILLLGIAVASYLQSTGTHLNNAHFSD